MPLSPSSCSIIFSKCKQVKKFEFESDFWSETFEFKFESNFDFLLQLSLSLTWGSCWSSMSSSNLVFFLQTKRKGEGGGLTYGWSPYGLVSWILELFTPSSSRKHKCTIRVLSSYYCSICECKKPKSYTKPWNYLQTIG